MAERVEFGILSKKITLINNIFHLLILFFFIGYCLIFSQIYKNAQSSNLIIILAQVLFWGAIFVVITIVLLKIMLETIVATKLNQTDSLTSLLNKMAGHGKIDEALITGEKPIFLAILDLDNFKKANDIYGHLVGDEILIKIAQIIKANVEKTDISCRFGGDEFVIALFDKIFALKFEKNKARIFSLIVLLPLWLFNLGKFSFYRIYITNIVRLIALKRKKEVSQLNLISAVMIGFLLIEPTLVINSSFYLGFGISLLLTFLRPTINRYSKFKRKFIPAFVIYFLLLPINLNSSYRLSLFGPLIQIIVRPIGTIIFILGYLSFLLNIVIRPIMPLIRLLLRLITLLAKLEFALEIAPFSAPILYVYYGLYLLFFIALEIGVHPLKNTSALIMTSLLLLQLVPLTNQISKAVYFINVGQGDSIVFRDHNVAVMIETGGSRYIDIAEEVLLPFLTKHHIRYLDAVITTHDDFDHNGALPGLLAHKKVKKTLTNEEEFPYTVGNLTFTNLNRNVALDADDNDKSLVLYVEFIGEQWLLMGDASVAVEHKIINSFPSLRCSILKVGHHGSSTSTSAEFLNHVKPRVAIISVGKNYYGHPTVSVITLLEERKIKIRRTDEESTITYSRFAL